MNKIAILALLALLAGCASTGSSGECGGTSGCPEAQRQIMQDALYNRPFGI